jgi:hypothetical protein
LNDFFGWNLNPVEPEDVRLAISSTYDGVWPRWVMPDLRADFGTDTMTAALPLCNAARLPLRWIFVGYRT